MKNTLLSRKKQSGAALVIGLILLLIITVFAVSGMSTTTLELILAGNNQFQENAFQSAESAIEIEFMVGPSPLGTTRTNNFIFEGSSTASTSVDFVANTIPPIGYSMINTSADHYRISATGQSGKNARSVNDQGFYVVIPSATGN